MARKKVSKKKTKPKKKASKTAARSSRTKKKASHSSSKKPAARAKAKRQKATTGTKKSTSRKKVGGKKSTSVKVAKQSPSPKPKSKASKFTIKDKRLRKPKSKSTTSDGKKLTALRGKRGRLVSDGSPPLKADAKGYVFINGRRVRMLSTKGAPKPTRSTEVAPAVVEPVEEAEPVKIGKTKLSRKELNQYRNLLLIKRAELVGDLSAMEAEALQSSGGNISHMPIHMADIGTDTYDQDFMLGLAEAEREQLREIDDALQRIEDRTYGVCQLTGEQIPKARLEAKLWAKYTVEAARTIESQLAAQQRS